jgi:hypothetical protein
VTFVSTFLEWFIMKYHCNNKLDRSRVVNLWRWDRQIRHQLKWDFYDQLENQLYLQLYEDLPTEIVYKGWDEVQY